jgi:hypothetical protein
MRAPDRLESFDKGAPDSPLPFPDQGHQFANFIVRVVAVLFARDEHRQHHCGLPFGKLDRSPQPALPMTVNTRIGSEISREVDEVGSTNRRCPDAKSAPGGCTTVSMLTSSPTGAAETAKMLFCAKPSSRWGSDQVRVLDWAELVLLAVNLTVAVRTLARRSTRFKHCRLVTPSP